MRTVRVIGLGGRTQRDDWHALLDGRVVVARHGESAHALVPSDISIATTFDAVLFTDGIENVVDHIAAELKVLAEDADVAFLVPGPGSVGDRVVERLSSMVPVEIYAGQMPAAQQGVGQAQIVDALALAEAEAQRPFDGGLVPLDGSVCTIICNWYGSPTLRLAQRRLMRTYASEDVYVQDAYGSLSRLALSDDSREESSFSDLIQVVARLRRPDGCPWDREQTHGSMLADLREEVDEVEAAIKAEDWDNLSEELGDVLLHVAMQAQMAAEAGQFTIDDVVAGIASKLVRRHPHVFGDVPVANAADVLTIWEAVKATEKRARQHEDA